MNKRGVIFSLLIILSVFVFTDMVQEKRGLVQMEEEQISKPFVPTIEMVNKDCFLSEIRSQTCKYSVGNDLEFTIWHIGDPDATVIVRKTRGEDGDYHVRFTLDSHCLFIRTGGINALKDFYFSPKQYAFVSLIDGLIYQHLEGCLKSRN